nr:peptidoglycan recognition family protein [Konateibacter massiliensis]
MLVISCILAVVSWVIKPKVVQDAPEFEVNLLTMNEYSRSGEANRKINGIVIHYTANPGTTAAQNRNYFEGLKDSQLTKASSHFIIGLEGEIIQCIPTNEIAYASNDRNYDTISIECCHADETGKFNEETYESLVHLTAWLCGKFDLKPSDVIRHYDVTGKLCPLYYVEHEDAWEQFIDDVKEYIDTYGIK